MAVIETWLNQDLQKPVKVQYIDGSLFGNNANGNRIGVVVTDNGDPVTISGTVSGYVVVSDGSTVPCTGAKSGNRASILIPPAAYVPGSAFISLFITDGTTVTTLAALSTTVLQTRTGTQVDPGSVVTDWTQTINGAMQDVQTAAANLGGIVATPYASLTYPVPLGKYTYYDGGLYRCISPIASSETFTPAHWTAVKLGDDVSDLKSAINNIEDVSHSNKEINQTWEQGSISTTSGTDSTSTTRIRTGMNYVEESMIVIVPSTMKISLRKYSAAGVFESSTDWLYGNQIIVPGERKGYRIVAAYTSDGTISASAGNSIKAYNSFKEEAYQRISVLENETYSINVVDTTWSQGTINNSTGADMTSTTRIRTSKIFLEKGIVVNVANGMKVSLRIYDGTSEYGNFEESTDWHTGVLYYSATEIKAYRIVAAYTDDSTIDVSAGENVNVHIYIPEEVDKMKNVNFKFTPSFEQGSFSTSGGEIASTTRIRTIVDYVQGIFVYIGSGLKFSWRAYTQNGSLKGYSDWISDSCKLNLPYGTTQVGIVVAYSNNEDITPEDNIDVYVEGKYEIITSEHTTTNSFCGNVSIIAAKTIYFNDGTQPIIDWYLLQSVNNRYFMSNDLKTKKYLFTFVPPTGKASDWSAGITKDNDIIFVANAAGLGDENGRLNDANRVNPVCYLASENYSTMHTIDFGNNLKPCGWLENVGYCVLPNGNIVFCEYTRGNVKTANVWLVSGRITNPSNWVSKWNTNIIDTTDETTAGIKHCHEVQYDFYTGILYFGTGDSPLGSYNYYSTDNGSTWTLLYGPNKNKCRRLTYVFTKDNVYWASDSHESENHHFFIADRDENGLIDIENATQINLPSDNNQACYGCVYLKSVNAIALMERIDSSGGKTFYWYAYDLTDNEIKLIGQIKSVNNQTAHLGFRCRFVDWYPCEDGFMVGYNCRTGSIMSDTNENALCGNGGDTNGNGFTRVNNLQLFVRRTGTGFDYQAKTLFV